MIKDNLNQAKIKIPFSNDFWEEVCLLLLYVVITFLSLFLILKIEGHKMHFYNNFLNTYSEHSISGGGISYYYNWRTFLEAIFLQMCFDSLIIFTILKVWIFINRDEEITEKLK